MDFLSGFVAGAITGGGATKLIDYLIDLARERDKRQSAAAAKARQDEMDKARLRVDVTILEPNHPQFKTILVEIKSLGVLPVTINYGQVAVYSSKYEQPVKFDQISRKEITSEHPIEFRLEVKNGIFSPMILGLGQAEIKLICKFSYGDDAEEYKDEQFYNFATLKFQYKQPTHWG